VIGRLFLIGALAVALAIIVAGACTPPVVVPPATTSAPTAAPTTAAPTLARPSPTASPTASPTPSPSPTGAPGSPAAACPTQRGGDPNAQAQLTAIRVAHDSGFDRLVFEFGPAPAGTPGTPGLPKWSVAVTSSFIATSGRQVPVDGNSFFQVLFQNASTVDPMTGKQTFTTTDLHPALPLIRNVKLIDDFERVMTWGLGVERLVCPKITELASPPRLVLDLPTPP